MNLDRLVAILRPLAYLEAVSQQLKKDIKKNKCWQQKNVIKIFHYSLSGKAEKVWCANVDPSLLSGNQKRIS